VRILITGSRDWTDGYAIENAILQAVNSSEDKVITIVHGGAAGADRISDNIAKKHGFNTEVHMADWHNNGRAAGIIRNNKMVYEGADICLAFIRNNSKGATHCSNAAMNADIPTRVFRINEEDEW